MMVSLSTNALSPASRPISAASTKSDTDGGSEPRCHSLLCAGGVCVAEGVVEVVFVDIVRRIVIFQALKEVCL